MNSDEHFSENQQPNSQSIINKASPSEVDEVVDPVEIKQPKEFNERLSDFFQSKEFIEFIEQVDDYDKERTIGVIIEYSVLHKDGFMFQEFLEILKERGSYDDYAISTFYVDSISKKLNLAEVDSQETKEAIWEYFYKNYEENGFCYHGFNGAFEDSIKEKGLTKGERLWNDKELERVTAIGKAHGMPMILGWHGINSSQNLFYDDSTRSLYQYATESPEWFSQLAAGGFNINVEDKTARTAFIRRDYHQAKNNIEDLCRRLSSNDEELIRQGRAYPNLTIEEQTEIMEFFEKHWALLAGEKSKPKAALIKKLVLEKDKIFSSDYESNCVKSGHDLETSIQQIIRFVIISEFSYVDLKTKEDILPQDFVLIDLPEYNTVYRQQ